MQTILFMNAKGGSGKSTLATNLAAYYAGEGHMVVLADFDTQGSCMDWLAVRSERYPAIHGVHAATRSLRVPRGTDYLVIDAPGNLHGRAIGRLVKKADTLVMPVTPSPVDIRAATRFIQELLLVRKVSRHETRMAVVANRVRPHGQGYEAMERFLHRLNIPLAASIRDSDNYLRAAGAGASIFEIEGHEVERDREEWQPLLEWLSGKAASLDLL
jgi:chromosome partitioning protein